MSAVGAWAHSKQLRERSSFCKLSLIDINYLLPICSNRSASSCLLNLDLLNVRRHFSLEYSRQSFEAFTTSAHDGNSSSSFYGTKARKLRWSPNSSSLNFSLKIKLTNVL
jgi:hypothetical protein